MCPVHCQPQHISMMDDGLFNSDDDNEDKLVESSEDDEESVRREETLPEEEADYGAGPSIGSAESEATFEQSVGPIPFDQGGNLPKVPKTLASQWYIP